MTYAKQDRDRHDDVAGRGQGIVNVCDPRPVGIAFGNGILNQPTSTLFFTAGPDDETHGLYRAHRCGALSGWRAGWASR